MRKITVRALSILLFSVLASSCSYIFVKDTRPEPVERHRTVTSDGWEIALYRYRPEAVVPGREPVLMCHGLQANRLNMDFSADVSLARYLQKEGFDSWIMEVRGGGESSRPGFLGLGKYRYNYCFDDYVMKDLPAAIEYVRKTTGFSKVQWVGHSNGGMVIHAYLSYFGPEGIKTATTVASPVDFTWMPDLMKLAASKLKNVLTLSSYAPLAAAAPLLNPFISDDYSAGIIGNGFANAESMGSDGMRFMVRYGIFDISNKVVIQMADWVENGEFRTFDKKFSYKANLKNISIPMFITAGRGDNIVPPATAKYAYDVISSKDKKWMVFGKASGGRFDFGHGDLLLGKTAPRDIYPHILAWLKSHAGP